ncbi:MAG: CBS domain-containing protein [Clostridiales bacterium]|nr:CBS domain-containing protein [Clostridiales bacterium]MDU2293460.1 CBS domain-containing protein [Peptococcus niger]MDU7505400.1 CBS domain-containing protein [Clostridia bacterium]MDU1029200.1 CBS domain-containing protein [Clostridiales bacterium]MDU5951915.1 CBS domain-containing protein [Clostridiales bacterium]
MAEPISKIMETDVYTANENDTIADVLKILVDKRTSGLPIINDNREIVGFISDGDIMKFIAKQDPRIIDMTSFITVWYDIESFDQKLEDLLKINVMELATTKAITVDINEAVDDVARVLGKKKIKKVPVEENGKLVGVISRSNIIRYIVQKHLS